MSGELRFLVHTIFSLWSHTAREQENSLRSFMRSPVPFMRTLPSRPSLLSKAPSPNIITLEWGLQYLNFGGTQTFQAFLVAQAVKNLPAMWETWGQSLGWEDPQEKGKAAHSSILSWRIPMDRGAWRATVHRVTKESDMTERLSTHTRQRISLWPAGDDPWLLASGVRVFRTECLTLPFSSSPPQSICDLPGTLREEGWFWQEMHQATPSFTKAWFQEGESCVGARGFCTPSSIWF